ncbi:Cold-regulated 413 plasma membrane protein 2 [Linum grandiflorum]
MRSAELLRMRTGDASPASKLIESDVDGLKDATMNFVNGATKLGGLGFGTGFLKWVASFAAIGDTGKWVAFIAVVLRLFYPRHFPDWLEMPGSLILLLVVAPHLFAHTLKEDWLGVAICLLIGCYLLQEHIRASGGFRNSFTQSHGISNTLGIILLIVYPVWSLVIHLH